MRKSRKNVEGPIIGIEKSQQKRKLRAMVSHWTSIVRNKGGMCVKRKDAKTKGCS